MPDPAASPDPGSPGDPVDSGVMEIALHHDLDRWREALARSLARNNLELKSDGIMIAVNRILFPLLLLRFAVDRHLVPDGTAGTLRKGDAVQDLTLLLAPYADALYADEHAAPLPGEAAIRNPVIDERVSRKILDELLAPDRHYDLRAMTPGALTRVLARYLTRTVRRSATHQATVVDTHDTIRAGGTMLPPGPVAAYLVKNAVRSARNNRSTREILPLRIFDPACGSGAMLLDAFQQLQEDAGGPALSFDERREILVHSLYGLDISRHAVAATRLVLLMELCSSLPDVPEGDLPGRTALAVLCDLGRTILCGNTLIGPEITGDESWMFCPVRDRQRLNPFAYQDRLPEIMAGGGFDAVISNPPEGALEPHEWIQQYFQRRYAAYHPLADRSVYFFEKGLDLIVPGGTVAMVMSGRFLRGAPGSPFRELLMSARIEEIADLSGVPAGSPGAGLCLLRASAARPGRSFPAVAAGAGFTDDPAGFAARSRFPVDQQALGAGGWTLRDTRADTILEKIRQRGTPLLDVVMGQVHAGIPIAGNDPLVIETTRAREWLRRDPRCRDIVRPFISARDAGHPDRFVILVPEGWTRSHPGAVKRPWQWFRHRHPLVARHLQQSADQLKARAGPGTLWWETACDGFWGEPHRKLFFVRGDARPFFWFDAGRGIGDGTVAAIPSSDLYLAGVLNSRLLSFCHIHTGCGPGTMEDPLTLPVYTPDLDRPEDRERHDRLEHLVSRAMDLEQKYRNAPAEPERETFRKKVRTTNAKIDALVYDLYGLTPEEIAVVEARSA